MKGRHCPIPHDNTPWSDDITRRYTDDKMAGVGILKGDLPRAQGGVDNDNISLIGACNFHCGDDGFVILRPVSSTKKARQIEKLVIPQKTAEML
ncbi:hypothetical protein D3C84_1031950 [compost metagenome]